MKYTVSARDGKGFRLGAADREPRAAFVELDFLEDGDGLRPLVTVEILEEE